jgi:hypothetical protein
VIFVGISFIVVAIIYSSSDTPNVFAAPKAPGFDTGVCTNNPETLSATCCWVDIDKGTLCQTCSIDLETGDFVNCSEPEIQMGQRQLPSDPTVPPQGGIEQPQTPPRLPGGGANVPPQGGVTQ